MVLGLFHYEIANKIISKVVVIRLKPIISSFSSYKQCGFLEGHQIHEEIEASQEGLHTMKNYHLLQQ